MATEDMKAGCEVKGGCFLQKSGAKRHGRTIEPPVGRTGEAGQGEVGLVMIPLHT